MAGNKTTRLPKATIGIIGGTGLYEIDGFKDKREVRLRTPFGDPSDAYVVGTLEGRRVAFLARHGTGPPAPSGRGQLPGQHIRFQEVGRRAHHLGQLRRLAPGGHPPARHRPRRTSSSTGPAGRTRSSAAGSSPTSAWASRSARSSPRSSTMRPSGSGCGSIAAGPTSASMGRPSPPRPSRWSTGPGAATSSA